MSRSGKAPAFLSCILFAVILIAAYAPYSIGNAETIQEIESRLESISEEEKAVLEELYSLQQEINGLRRESEGIQSEIENLNIEIEDKEKAIAAEELSYNANREALKQVLVSYQRGGPGTFIEILLNSENLSGFLSRINILRELMHGTDDLLNRLEESKAVLVSEKENLDRLLEEANEKNIRLAESIDKGIQKEEELKSYLASLADEKEHYMEQLAGVQRIWEELKPVFAEAAGEFSRIIEEGNLPADAIEISFDFFSVKGSISEDTINQIIAQNPVVSKMVFKFTEDSAEVSIPEKGLSVGGIFVVEDSHTLKFEAQEGTFFGLPLNKGTLDELFEQGALALNLETVLGRNTLDSVKISDGFIELEIIPVFY